MLGISGTTDEIATISMVSFSASLQAILSAFYQWHWFTVGSP
jgi:hypothetical protein